MLLALAKLLNEVDRDLSLRLHTTKEQITLAVESSIGELYSFTTTDLFEAVSKIQNFIACLKSPEKFDTLLKEIETVPLEVALEE